VANEKKTEAIVRKHFETFSDSISLEEQISDNAKIAKLLQNASKRGSGRGRPEFLITLNDCPELLIVIECKADKLKHESEHRNKFSEYAVDGVLLYSQYLSKEFDVLAIAVSGSDSRCKVSHFLQLKGENRPTEAFGDKLLSVADYIEGYIKSPQKFRQDYERLIEFSKDLNDELHVNKILESQRSLLISCILIALDNAPFKASYKHYASPKELADNLVTTVINELSRSSVGVEKIENLKIQFSFIKTDTTLSTKKGVLKKLIDDIDQNINSFLKTHEYFDVLGQLYIEFLRYANSDKGLGIVLTPPHITEFFAEIAQVNKNSIVCDTCTGTGGFLIGAMRKMIRDAKDDSATIKKIKAEQLIGVEYQAHIYALAVSNMYIHQDGKSNILNGSCFDREVIKHLKGKRPNIGMLNPPYKSDKKKDVEELEFVLNNLECLIDGGTCVAIVPMQCALAQTGKILDLKRQLLTKHTLEAVFSMPDELFFNSDVNVVSCIMVFTAHRPHPRNKETFFGYFKKDGFEKRKIKGRIDANGLWDEIRNEWVSLFLNGTEKTGLSVRKAISAKDEWCAEAYIQTDYDSLVSEYDFEMDVRKFAAFVLTNRIEAENV